MYLYFIWIDDWGQQNGFDFCKQHEEQKKNKLSFFAIEYY